MRFKWRSSTISRWWKTPFLGVIAGSLQRRSWRRWQIEKMTSVLGSFSSVVPLPATLDDCTDVVLASWMTRLQWIKNKKKKKNFGPKPNCPWPFPLQKILGQKYPRIIPRTPLIYRPPTKKIQVWMANAVTSLHSIPLRFAPVFAHFSPINWYQGLYIYTWVYA